MQPGRRGWAPKATLYPGEDDSQGWWPLTWEGLYTPPVDLAPTHRANSLGWLISPAQSHPNNQKKSGMATISKSCLARITKFFPQGWWGGGFSSSPAESPQGFIFSLSLSPFCLCWGCNCLETGGSTCLRARWPGYVTQCTLPFLPLPSHVHIFLPPLPFCMTLT